MFEEITAFLPRLKNDSYGKWIRDEKTEDGTNVFPYVEYTPTVKEFTEGFYNFAVSHKELGIMRCEEILDEAEIDLNELTLDVLFQLDGRTVASIIMVIIRSERFCTGSLLSYLKDESIQQCLERLKEIDDGKD